MRHGLWIGLLLTLAAPAVGGDWKYISHSPGRNFVTVQKDMTWWAPRVEGDGTVSPHAWTAKSRRDPLTIAVAIDSAKPDAKAPDLLRLDFTGKGKFADAPTVPLKSTHNRTDYQRLEIVPTRLKVPHNGQVIPVTVYGQYRRTNRTGQSIRRLTLQFQSASQGMCQFGEKTYAVRLLDMDGNLALGDKPFRVEYSRGFSTHRGGDRVLIDTGDGTFSSHDSVIEGFCGHPICVDGLLYSVTVGDDGFSATASPSPAETAMLKLPHNKWAMTLVGKRHIFSVSGGTDPVIIPADKYTVVDFYQTAERGKRIWVAEMDPSSALRYGTAKQFDAPAGKTVHLAIGAPLSAAVKSRLQGRTLSLDFKLNDNAGQPVRVVGGAKSLGVEVFDAAGKQVHAGTFEYG